jgi:hypothetical protein
MASTQPMGEWIFTFGWDHRHPETGERMFNRFVRIAAQDPDAAREEMVRRFALKWSHQYDSADEAGVDRFGLVEFK